MKVNINITNLDKFEEQSKAVELAAKKLQEEYDESRVKNIHDGVRDAIFNG